MRKREGRKGEGGAMGDGIASFLFV